jgi:hypothetical protein
LGHNDGGHKVHYQHLPPDEPVLLVTVTVNDNEQVVSNIQSLTTSCNVVNNFVFEPTTPEQFKQKLQSLLASQKQ